MCSLGRRKYRKNRAIGVPGFGWKIRIVDENRKDVPQGEVGELAVYGPGVMVCYYKNPDATKDGDPGGRGCNFL